MPTHTSISVTELARAVGTGRAPVIVDVRNDTAFAADARLIPGSRRDDAAAIVPSSEGWDVVIYCAHGRSLSQSLAARLRHDGMNARHLEGGFEAWKHAGELLVRTAPLPGRDAHGRTVWVTRERPKIDRIACPWLIRRFIDPEAVILFVAAGQVEAVAKGLDAAPFDIDGVHWSHRGERCTFDTMIEELGLSSPALDRLATIVRGADTARLDLAPQAAGLLAVSLGLSRLFDDDLAQLAAGLTLYDALYLWCRDAAHETHNWPTKAS